MFHYSLYINKFIPPHSLHRTEVSVHFLLHSITVCILLRLFQCIKFIIQFVPLNSEQFNLSGNVAAYIIPI